MKRVGFFEDYFRKNYVGIFLMLMGKEVMFKET